MDYPRTGAREALRRVACGIALLTILFLSLASFAQSGTALQFNAAGPDQGKQFVNLGSNLKLGDPAINGGAFTIETWFKREGMGKFAMMEYPAVPQVFAVPLISRGNWNNTSYFLGVDYHNRVLVADFDDIDTGSGHPIYGHTILSDDKWYHAAAVYDGSTWSLYLDGNLEGTLAVGKTPKYNAVVNTSLASAISGGNGIAEYTYNGWFQGSMDEVRFWTVARTAQQLSENKSKEIGSAEGLLARYGLNEGSGTIAHDSSGSMPAFNGVLGSQSEAGAGGPAAWVTGSPFQPGRAKAGDRALALNLMGNPYMPGDQDNRYTGAYVDLGTNSALGLSNFTIETWINWAGGGDSYLGDVRVPPGTGKYGSSELYAFPIIAKGTDRGGNYYLGLTRGAAGDGASDAQLVAFFQNRDNIYTIPIVLSSQRIPKNSWHHVAVTFDGIQLQLYIDGALDGQTATNGAVPNAGSASALSIAGGQGQGLFAGSLEQVHIWNYARSQGQIADGRTVNSTEPESGLVGRWSMDAGGSPISDLGGTSEAGGVLAGNNWVYGAGVPSPLFNWTDPNHAPVVTDPGATSSNQGDIVLLEIVASDVDYDTLAYSATGLPPGLSIFSGSGTITGTATTAGTYNVTVNVDDNGAPVTQNFVWTVTHVSLPPQAADDTYSLASDGILTVPATAGVLVNDSSPDAKPLTAVLIGSPAHGTVMLNADGSFTYNTAGYSGLDGFTYQASDGTANSATATVTINIRAALPPHATNDIYSMLSESTLTATAATGVLGNDSDPDGKAPLTAVLLSSPVHGTLTLSLNGAFTYSTADYSGADSFTYKATNGTLNSNTSTVVINIIQRNYAPGVPMVIAPQDGATGVPTAATLDVTVSDPNQDPLTVNFFGRKASSSLAPDFTFVALPDAQQYTGLNDPSFAAQTQWVVDNRQNLNIQFVTQLGDITNANAAYEWQNASDAMATLDAAGLPNNIDVGNHDVDGAAPYGSAGYDQFFPVSRYAFMGTNYGYLGSDPVADADDMPRDVSNNIVPNGNRSNYELFSVGYLDFIVLHLQLDSPNGSSYPDGGKSPNVLRWADRILKKYANRRAIISTHIWIESSGGRASGPFTRRDGTGTGAEDIWQQLVSPNCNVFMTLNGHDAQGAGDEGMRVDNNACGNPVHQMMMDYEARNRTGTCGPFTIPNDGRGYCPYGGWFGDGWLRYLTFKPAQNKIEAFTYTPTWNEYEETSPGNGIGGHFSFDYDMGAPANQLIDTKTVASGAHATTTWSNLEMNAQYSWYTEVSDGVNPIVVSPTWIFTTTLPNRAPVASNGTFTADPNVAKEFILSATDLDGDALTYSIVAGPAHGELSGAAPSVTYTPTAGYLGTDSFTFKVNDGKVDSNVATVTITTFGTLTVSVTNATRPYGDTNPVFAGTITGLMNGDDITATFSTTADASSIAGSYSIVPTFVDPAGKLGNYKITSNNGILTVTAVPLTVTADDAIRLFGEPNPTFTGTITGLKNSDNITATFATAAISTSPVDTYPIVPTLVDPTSRGGNYTLVANNGTLTIQSKPATVSVMPSAGTGASQFFQLTYSDPAGFASIDDAQVILSSVRSYGRSCSVAYTVSTGSIQIKDDSGLNWSTSAKLGVAGVLQNNQCSIDAGASSAVGAGNNLTVNLAVTFKPTYVGTKNIYMLAYDQSGLNSGWQTLGTWTVPAGSPSVLSVTPSTGTGASQLFQLSYSDPAGFAAITSTQTILSSVRSYTGGCAVLYTASTGSIQMKDDSGLNWSAAAKLGVAGVLQNTQCSIDLGTSSAVGAGNNLTLSLAVTFKPTYAGAKNVYSYATNRFAFNAGWQTLGTWTVPAGAPSVLSVTPNAGTGASQLIQLTYSDAGGFAAISTTQTILSSVRSYTAGCAVLYTASTGSIQMKDDSGLNWSAAAKLGVAEILQNTQCSIDAGASSAAGAGTNLTLSLAVSFKPAYAGAKNIYSYAADKFALNSGWQTLGTWTVPAGAPSVLSVTPSTGTGTSQLFQLAYSDAGGFAAISSTQTILSGVRSYGAGCAVLYTASTGSIQLKDDSGLNWSAAAKLGVAGVLQNSQCGIDLGTTSAVGAGNNLTLSYAVTFKSAYVGTKNIYSYASNKFALNSGWQTLGTWIP